MSDNPNLTPPVVADRETEPVTPFTVDDARKGLEATKVGLERRLTQANNTIATATAEAKKARRELSDTKRMLAAMAPRPSRAKTPAK